MGAIHILHVDDEQPFVEAASELLEREDDRFTVRTAAGPIEGRKRLAAEAFDCVISDYNMPGENGIEFLRTIREEYPNLPFILFTGKGSEEVASEAISAGVTDYLQKSTASEQYELLANRIRTAVSQYRTEQRLERQNDLFRKAQDLANVGAWEYLIEGDTSHESDQLMKIHGLDPDDDLKPEKSLQYYHPRDRPKIRKAFTSAVEAGEPYDLELRFIDDDGNDRWVRTRGEPQYEDGELVRVRGTIQDITDRKHRELKLKRYEAIVENTEAGVYVIDEHGQLDFVNQSVVDTTGIPRSEWIGQHVSALVDFGIVTETDASAIENAIEAIIEGDETAVSMELRPELSSTPDVLYLRLTPLETTKSSDVLGFTRDITEFKRRKWELERQNERLEEFASVVSHDIRNPLSVASLHLELAGEESDNEHLEKAADAIERSEALVDDLLTLARDGESVGETESVALDEIATNCWKNVESDGEQLRIETSQNIQANPSRLQQLLENLYRNAVEHGGSTIAVGALTNGFYVEDDGPGLPAEPDELFEPGYSTSDDGTGFGLYIVEQIATAHGWDVQLTAGSSGGLRVELTDVEFEG